jgi:ketosteroid isomerase-like protein
MAAASRNIENTRGALEAFNRRDPEAYIAYVREDYEWRPFLFAAVEGGVYRGHEGVRKWFANLDESFESFSLEVSEMRDLGDRLLVTGTLHVRGRGSGVPVESAVGIVADVDSDGLARRGVAFTSQAEALAYAGIES